MSNRLSSELPRGLAVLPFLCALSLAAQPIGPAFRVSSSGPQETSPRVASAGTGTFVVVWSAWLDGDAAIVGRLFRAAGAPLGPQFRVDEGVSFYNDEPRAAMAEDGGFLVVWRRNVGLGVRGFDASGAPRGPEKTLGEGAYPRIAARGDEYVVVWEGVDTSLHGRTFSPSGEPLEAEFRVNELTAFFDQSAGTVACAADGSFLVAWTRTAGGSGTWRVVARRFNAAGAPLGAEFPVNPDREAPHANARTAALASGDFVVVWRDVWEGTIGARLFGRFGPPLGPPFRVSDPGSVGLPWVAPAGDGFVVAWPRGDDVLARRFDAAGAPAGPASLVGTDATGAPGNEGPTVAPTTGDGFVVTWTAVGSPTFTYGLGQRYGAGVVGDANGDGEIGVADVFALINHLFAGGPEPFNPCDVNADGSVTVADVFALIGSLFGADARRPPR